MNMKKYFNVIFAALLVLAFMPACGNGGGEGDADVEVTPDVPTEDIAQEDIAQEDAPGDPPADEQLAEQEVIEDTPEEEAPACPADDPPTHVYIDVDGTVVSLDHVTSVDGILASAISPVAALAPGDPPHLAEDTVGADGAFAFDCLDVGEVAFGLVVLTDDSGATDTFYPTGTGVKGWLNPADKTDVTNATVIATPNTAAAGLETLAGMDFDATGVAMGLVIDQTTGNPIDGAEVVRTPSGTLNVVYLNADMDGLETDGNTSTSGMFIITDSLTSIINITVNASGYTFVSGQAATKAGFIYFIIMAGTPA
jgi:hypothetical protein